MHRLLIRILPALQLTRVSSAFAAVANVWFVILWSRALPQEAAHTLSVPFPLWLLLVGSAFNALGLFAFATALNDIIDFRRDQALNPDRPIPSGKMTMERAVTLVALSLGCSILGATVLSMSSVLLTLLIAAAILFFNIAGRYVPAVGLVLLGLIYAGQMVIPNINLRFVWPVWLVMTHALAVAALTHVVGRKVPSVSPRAVFFAIVGWLFWSTIIFTFGVFRSREDSNSSTLDKPLDAGSSPLSPQYSLHDSGGSLWPDWIHPYAWTWPVLLIAVFVILVWIRIKSIGPGQRAADKISRYGALWLALYSCAWMIGQRLWSEAIILSSLTLAGFVGMTLLREVVSLIEHPIAYRR